MAGRELTCLVSAVLERHQSRSASIAASTSVPSEIAGATRLAVRPTAKWPTNISCSCTRVPWRHWGDASCANRVASGLAWRGRWSTWRPTRGPHRRTRPAVRLKDECGALRLGGRRRASSRRRTWRGSRWDRGGGGCGRRVSWLCLAGFEARSGGAGQLFHAVELAVELRAAGGCQTVGLLFPRSVFLRESLDPAIFQEASKSAIKC